MKRKESLRLLSCFQERKGGILSLLQSWVSIGLSSSVLLSNSERLILSAVAMLCQIIFRLDSEFLEKT